MTRSDANQLTVPDPPQEKTADPAASESPGPSSQVGTILGLMDKASKQKNRCESCKCSLSLIEQKMGRCLTCGKAVGQGDTQANDSVNSQPDEFQVHI